MKLWTLLYGAVFLFALTLNLRANEREYSIHGLAKAIQAIENAARDPHVPESIMPSPPNQLNGEAREWLIAVFMNGRHNQELSNFAIRNLNEMELAGSSEKVVITAELGLINDQGNSTRLYIQKDTTTAAQQLSGEIISPFIRVTNSDMGSWKHFAEFVNWSYKKYPAKKILVVLWGHGTGRLDYGGADNTGAELGISYDATRDNFIRNKQLGEATAAIKEATGKTVSVFAMDSCLMQMAEIAYEINDNSEFILGSEETLNSNGFAYQAILDRLNSRPKMSPQELASLIALETKKRYLQINDANTISVLKTSKLKEFNKLLNNWIKEIVLKQNRAKILEAEKETLAFENNYSGPDAPGRSASKDLYDFVQKTVKKLSNQPKAVNKGTKLTDFIKQELIIANEISQIGGELERAGGLGIYFPKLLYDASYDESAFAKDSLWDDFIKWKLSPSYKLPDL